MERVDALSPGEESMKTANWNVVPALALMMIVSGTAVSRATPAPQSAATKVGDGAEKATAAVVKGATVATNKTKDALSKTGEVMTDGWITTRVHERFVGDDLLKGSDISVKTRKHVVTLTGTVAGRDGRARATSIARGTEGVHRVVNHLKIGAAR